MRRIGGVLFLCVAARLRSGRERQCGRLAGDEGAVEVDNLLHQSGRSHRVDEHPHCMDPGAEAGHAHRRKLRWGGVDRNRNSEVPERGLYGGGDVAESRDWIDSEHVCATVNCDHGGERDQHGQQPKGCQLPAFDGDVRLQSAGPATSECGIVLVAGVNDLLLADCRMEEDLNLREIGRPERHCTVPSLVTLNSSSWIIVVRSICSRKSPCISGLITGFVTM